MSGLMGHDKVKVSNKDRLTDICVSCLFLVCLILKSRGKLIDIVILNYGLMLTIKQCTKLGYAIDVGHQ